MEAAKEMVRGDYRRSGDEDAPVSIKRQKGQGPEYVKVGLDPPAG